jgi:hypothetical protein
MIHNVSIQYPFNDIEIFYKKSFSAQPDRGDVNLSGIDLTEILPITCTLQFDGDYNTDPINVVRDDILVDTFFDENNNAIPIYLQVQRIRGAMFGKNQVSKKCELTVYRKTLEPEVDAVIQAYLEYVEDIRKNPI